jgi:hypothetical protein
MDKRHVTWSSEVPPQKHPSFITVSDSRFRKTVGVDALILMIVVNNTLILMQHRPNRLVC